MSSDRIQQYRKSDNLLVEYMKTGYQEDPQTDRRIINYRVKEGSFSIGRQFRKRDHVNERRCPAIVNKTRQKERNRCTKDWRLIPKQFSEDIRFHHSIKDHQFNKSNKYKRGTAKCAVKIGQSKSSTFLTSKNKSNPGFDFVQQRKKKIEHKERNISETSWSNQLISSKKKQEEFQTQEIDDSRIEKLQPLKTDNLFGLNVIDEIKTEGISSIELPENEDFESENIDHSIKPTSTNYSKFRSWFRTGERLNPLFFPLRNLIGFQVVEISLKITILFGKNETYY